MADNNNCQICGVNKKKYFCPRCSIPYCSLSCYQSQTHLQCSEIFYEKWVQEELKNPQSDPQVKKQMLEILKQNQESEPESLDSDDYESEPDLACRMSGVNLDDEEAVWEKLTPEEKKNFRKLIANGDIIKLLPDWEPWWKVKKKKTLIQECNDESDWKSLCPAVANNLPKLSTITKSQPSSNIPFMVLNVLASYVYTVRWFKGSHKDMPVESISTIIALSRVLKCNQVFEDPVAAFVAFEDDLAKCDWLREEEYKKDTIHEDMLDIIQGGDVKDPSYCVKAAISDLDAICNQAAVVIKDGRTHHLKRFSGSLPKVSLLQQISKKLNYYLSWTTDYGQALINIGCFS